MKHEALAEHISKWLKSYCEQAGCSGFVVGVSGGIDSALTSYLCAMTGLETLCLEMPIHQAPNQVSRAAHHIEALMNRFSNVRRQEVHLTEVFETFKSSVPQIEESKRALALANTRARLRMSTLYYFAGIENKLVAGTGNKVEDFGVGFYTKYGDGGVDLSPIADLMKSEVYALATHLGVIDSILQAAPTDGLFGDNRSDEDQLGASYDELEWAMEFDGDESALSDRQTEVLRIYRRLNSANKHKMNPIPVCEIPADLLD
jgi:NAD+ synthase